MIKIPAHVNSLFKLVYRRGRRFGLAILLILLIEQFWSAMHTTSLQEFQTHSHQLMSLTAEQAATEARHWIMADDTDNLEQLVAQLQQQPFIAAAQIQNRYGQSIATSLQQTESDQVQQALVLVEEVIDDGKVVGYLTLTVDESLLLKAPVRTHEYLTFYGQFLLGFAVLAGIFMAITFNRWRYKRVAINHPTE
jgi:uncharacterized membrane protein affecting hemolysin expression